MKLGILAWLWFWLVFVCLRNDDEIGKKIQEKIVLKKDDAVIKNYELMEHKHTHRKHIYLMLIAACDISYGYYDF